MKLQHDEKMIEEILPTFSIAGLSDGIKKYMKQYAEHMVQLERERIKRIVETVANKNESNGRYNACNEIINLINK